MSTLVPPIGHDALVERIRRATADSDGPRAHAVLLVGPEGIGKYRIAQWWAARLKCVDRENCQGDCESCRMFAAGSHPDLFEVEPNREKRHPLIGIGHIRGDRKEGLVGLIPSLVLRPIRPGPRVAIVRDAQTMNLDAQNAALKLLEEPPGDAVLFLVTDNAGTLLPTVRSRCQTIRVAPLAEDDIARILEREGADPAAARGAAMLARGSVGRALTYDAEGLERREAQLVALEQLLETPEGALTLAESLAAEAAPEEALGEVLAYLLTRVHAALGETPAEPSAELTERLRAAAQERPADALARADRTLRTLGELARNANAKIAIRDLLLNNRRPAPY